MTGQLAKDRTSDRTAGTGQSGQVNLTCQPERSAWMGEPGQDREDRTART